MRWAFPATIATLAVVLGTRGLVAGDPVGALALTDDRLATSADLGDDAWLDPARDLARLRPWQPGFDRARRCLAGIAEARRIRYHAPDAPPMSTGACR